MIPIAADTGPGATGKQNAFASELGGRKKVTREGSPEKVVFSQTLLVAHSIWAPDVRQLRVNLIQGGMCQALALQVSLTIGRRAGGRGLTDV